MIDPSDGFEPVEGKSYSVFTREIAKSTQDKQSYRVIKLANELIACVVSDATQDTASAAMSVRVGQLHDPQCLPGLGTCALIEVWLTSAAHFAEHLLFQGSKRFPEVNEYDRYLSANGGESNAFTCLDATQFYFSISVPGALDGALDRFSGFFVEPLFDPGSVEREVNAVDSEHTGKLQSDLRRGNAVFKHLGNPRHPANSFGAGNLDSLWTTPRQKGIDVRAELVEFVKTHYSANQMRLCVVGNQSPDELSDMVARHFSAVPNRQLEPTVWSTDVLSDRLRQHITMYETIRDKRVLDIGWTLSDQDQYWRTKPADYIAYLIGRQDEGSLLAELKRRGWASEIEAGSDGGALGFLKYSVAIYLTPAGLNHWRDVTELFFAQLELLRTDLPEAAFRARAAMAELEFKYEEHNDATTTASELCSSLFRSWPIDEILSAQWIADHFDRKIIGDLLAQLNASSCRIAIASRVPPDDLRFDATEPLFSVKYTQIRFDEALRQRCRCPQDYAGLAAPQINPFIPQDTSIARLPSASNDLPALIRSDARGSLYFLRDSKFKVPRTYAWFLLRTPASMRTARDSVLKRIWTDLIDEKLAHIADQASNAGLTYALCCDTEGLCLSFSGYTMRMGKLVDAVLGAMKSDLSDERASYDRVYEAYERELRNADKAGPLSQAASYQRWLLTDHYHSPIERLEELKSVTLARVDQYGQKQLGRLCQQSFVQSDAPKADSLTWFDAIQKQFKYEATPSEDLAKPRSYNLPAGSESVFRRDNLNPDDGACGDHRALTRTEDSALLLYVGLGNYVDHARRVRFDLIASMAEQPLFDDLRTKQQLGYHVQLGSHSTGGSIALIFAIQGKHDPNVLEAAVERFLIDFEDQLVEMTAERFDQHVDGLRRSWLETFKAAEDQATAYWNQIDNGRLDWNKFKHDAARLNGVTKNEVIDLYREWIKPGGKERAQLSIQIVSQRIDSEVLQPLLEECGNISFEQTATDGIDAYPGDEQCTADGEQEAEEDAQTESTGISTLQALIDSRPTLEAIATLAGPDIAARAAAIIKHAQSSSDKVIVISDRAAWRSQLRRPPVPAPE